MRVIADTSVWSIALMAGRNHDTASKLRHMIVTGDQVFLLGILLQEILQGIRDDKMVEKVADELRAFDLLPLNREVYQSAAELQRRCRAKGVVAGTIDCLIAATAEHHDCFLLTRDRDFEFLAEQCELQLI